MFSIEEGDFAIIDPDNRSPDPGDYVLSVINGCANIKRFYIDKEHGQLLLLSESSENQPPIRLHEDDNLEFFINGKVVTVIKQPPICPH
jgi:SOS-response transcriptional repressor LexA